MPSARGAARDLILEAHAEYDVRPTELDTIGPSLRRENADRGEKVGMREIGLA